MSKIKKQDYDLFAVRIINFESDLSIMSDRCYPQKNLEYAQFFIDDWCKEWNFKEGSLLLRIYKPMQNEEIKFEVEEVLNELPNI
ncbi:MAG TPA: hypothetical protein P5277_00195 [Candidatus Paceibacterota bacterium]|nr:hypothetical protein [Candidatus Paceibacterota bacterium]